MTNPALIGVWILVIADIQNNREHPMVMLRDTREECLETLDLYVTENWDFHCQEYCTRRGIDVGNIDDERAREIYFAAHKPETYTITQEWLPLTENFLSRAMKAALRNEDC